MATVSTDIQFSGFTKYLIQDGLLTENEAKIIARKHKKIKPVN